MTKAIHESQPHSEQYVTAFESAQGFGYGQQATETGTEHPSVRERIESTFTGRTPEEQATYDRGTREYSRATGAATGTGTRTGTGSLADSMLSTMSTRPSLESGYGTGTPEQAQANAGERMKSVFTGRTAQEQHQHDYVEQQRQHQHQHQHQHGTVSGSGYTTGTREEQPTFKERVEATFTGRTAQDQHAYNARQRYQRQAERLRGGSGSTSEPGLMSSFGNMMTTSGLFGAQQGRKLSFAQRIKESIHDIRTCLTETGTRGDT